MQERNFSLVTLVLLLALQLCTGEEAKTNGVLKIDLRKHHKRGHHNLTGVKGHVKNLRCLEETDDIELKDIKDMYYIGPIYIGTPGQKLLVDFDSGSADLWVASHGICYKKQTYCQKHATYYDRKSKTYQKDGKTFSITYGSGFVYGFVSQDDVRIGSLTVKGQKFGETLLMDELTSGSDFDGILGLAYSGISALRRDPPFVELIKQGLVKDPVFAFYLNSAERSMEHKGELVLGGLDPRHYTGPITYTPVIEKRYWKITVDRLACGDFKANSFGAIPDSGTSLLVGPYSITEPINQMLNGNKDPEGIHSVECNNIPSFPNVTFTISGTPFVLTSDDYIMKLKDDFGGTVCTSAFVGVGQGFFILGDVFMRKFYTIFDMGQDRVGFATAAE